MRVIKKVKLHNFKRFKDFEVELDEKLNIFVGENESGKSSILSAINLTLAASRSQFDKIGVERLLNTQSVDQFLASDKAYEKLPRLWVELWFNDLNQFEVNGKYNSLDIAWDGIRMECLPMDDASAEVKEILEQSDANFPFEYYTLKFTTFSGDAYTGYKRYLRHIVIDNSLTSNDYAIREYVTDMYSSLASGKEKNKHQNEYRKSKEIFKNSILGSLNERVTNYEFGLKNDVKTNLQTDLTILEGSVGIDNKGMGKQCFIKTEFALRKAEGLPSKIDIALIEEPENHLSHVNMKRLINMIAEADDKQLLVATHSNIISARLDLRNTILLHTESLKPLLLKSLPEDTAKFFIKAPNHGVLNFTLSRKVILVEGDAEFMLLEKFYKNIKNESLENHEVHVLSVGGTSFKRYLDIAKILGVKVAVIRDNDKDYAANCVDLYVDYVSPKIKIFADSDNARYTFEVCIYQDNATLCDGLFSASRRTITVQDYMIKNKTDAAFALLQTEEDISIPSYIREAVEWISG